MQLALLLLSRVYHFICYGLYHITTPFWVPDSSKVVKPQARKGIVAYSLMTLTHMFLLFRFTSHTDITRAWSYVAI